MADYSDKRWRPADDADIEEIEERTPDRDEDEGDESVFEEFIEQVIK